MAPRAEADDLTDWQLQCGEIKQRGAQLLKTERWSDCSFLVGDSPNQVVMKAHKLILAMASPVFEAMFYGPIAECANPILIPDIQPETFKVLLEYIYTDNIELDSFTSACSLYYGAQKYMLPHLLTVCTTYLSCNLTPELACPMYEFVQMVGEKPLIEECEKLIQTETSSILQNKGFEEASIDTIEKIFAMDKLNISNELDLFKAAERYAKSLDSSASATHCMETETWTENVDGQVIKEEKNTSDDEDNANDENNEKDQENNKSNDLPDHNYCIASTSKEKDLGIGLIRKLVQHIRFLTLTPSQLAEYPTLTSLLTESEILALMMNTASTKTHVPMPPGLSTSRERRGS
ncbi:BTB/POZ domain-containing protein [Phthorimaea operculella]|nr:BTB/POZ domain-containing protein [Phthorimaea operculella]